MKIEKHYMMYKAGNKVEVELWIKKYWPVLVAAGVVVALPLAACFVIVGIEGKFPDWQALHAEQWVSLVGGGLTYLGTCIMGLLVFGQNIQAREESRIETNRANGISSGLLDVEKRKNRPIIGIRGRQSSGGFGLTLIVRNYKPDPILDLRLYNMKFSCDNSETDLRAKEIRIEALDGESSIKIQMEVNGFIPTNAKLDGRVECTNCLGMRYLDIFTITAGKGANLYFKNKIEKGIEPIESQLNW